MQAEASEIDVLLMGSANIRQRSTPKGDTIAAVMIIYTIWGFITIILIVYCNIPRNPSLIIIRPPTLLITLLHLAFTQPTGE